MNNSINEAYSEPKQAHDLAKAQLYELQESGWDMPDDVYRYLPRLIGKWIETDNPTFIDQALHICLEHSFPIIACLNECLKDISYRRYLSLPFAPRQTAKTAAKSSYDYQVHLWLANLHAAGVKSKQASLVAAHIFSKKFPNIPTFKACTLQKAFHTKMAEYSHNGTRLDEIAKEQHIKHPYLTIRWLNIANAYKDCPQELVGLRGNESDYL
jgi:hypothetical protein